MPPGQSIPFDGFKPFDDALHSFDGTYLGPIGGGDADLAIAYQAGPAGFASRCSVAWSFDAGRPFDDGRLPYDAPTIEILGILDTADELAYSIAAHTTHTLRYLAGPPIKSGDRITIDTLVYEVVGVPQRLNRFEMRAALVLMRE